MFVTSLRRWIENFGKHARSRVIDGKTYRIVHLTSAHPALDGRIFHKECRSLARAGYEVMQVGNYDLNGIVDGVRLRGLGSSKDRFQRFTSRLFVYLPRGVSGRR